METVLAITISLPKDLNKTIEKTQAKYFGRRIVDEAHITLYLCKFPARNYKRLVLKLEEADLLQLKIVYGKPKINITPKNHFYFLPIRSSQRLSNIHETILLPANSLRAGLIRNKDKKRLKESRLDQTKVKNLIQYGYAHVLDNFNPHITLGTIPPLSAKDNLKMRLAAGLLHFKTGSFIAKAINVTLCDYDDKTDSYYTKELTRIKLKSI